jgi:UDP-N-acetylglucosamine transferase subunit ALG13
LIFVILGGVVEYDFSRILKILDELVFELSLKTTDVVAQIGHSKYEPNNYDWFRFVDGKEFNNYIEAADVVITHGGVGSILKAMSYRKKVIIFPRLYIFKEHLDNHQTEISQKLYNEGYVLYAENKEELKKSLNAVKTFSPRIWTGNNELMKETVYNYLSQI